MIGHAGAFGTARRKRDGTSTIQPGYGRDIAAFHLDARHIDCDFRSRGYSNYAGQISSRKITSASGSALRAGVGRRSGALRKAATAAQSEKILNSALYHG
jgi:hypothetical protein